MPCNLPTARLSREEAFVKAVLEDKGAQVGAIPLCQERTPDFDVRLGGAHYIVEVKTREEDQGRAAVRDDALRRGQVHGDSDELKRKNTISGIIESGADQLRGFGPYEALRLLWLHCCEPFGERYKYQFFNALYGSTRVYDIDDRNYKVECLYYRDSDFFRYRDVLDGVVITMELGNEEVQLFTLLNDHSPKYPILATSPITEAFPLGLHDPLLEEGRGDAVVVRGPLDRRDANAVMAHLQGLTGRQRLFSIDFHHTSATIAVPRTAR